jgi:hypothetical protein
MQGAPFFLGGGGAKPFEKKKKTVLETRICVRFLLEFRHLNCKASIEKKLQF